jgi:hypothetical protein
MKYIIFKDTKSGLIQPVLFGEHTSHHQVKISRAKAVSAGFFDVENQSVYGKSDSLKLESNPKDLDYIIRAFMNMGTIFFIEGNI